MALTKFEKDMGIIAKLDDEPNDVGGLTSAELKAKFDEGGKALQKYLNDVLLPELLAALEKKVETSTAVNGHPLTENVTVTKADVGLGNVDNTSDMDKPVSDAQGEAIRQVEEAKADKTNVLEKDGTTPYTPTAPEHPANKGYVDKVAGEAVLGQVPDGSITTQKLVDRAVTAAKLAEDIAPATVAFSESDWTSGTLTIPKSKHKRSSGFFSYSIAHTLTDGTTSHRTWACVETDAQYQANGDIILKASGGYNGTVTFF